MKKIFAISAFVTAGLLAHGQGTVIFNSNNLGVLTNTALSHFEGGAETGGTSGKTSIAAGGFMYALFIQTYTGSLAASATNPTAGGWALAASGGTPVMGTNGTSGPQSGSILGSGGAGGVGVDGWALPSGATYDTAGREYFMVAGWSTALGTTWAQIAAQLSSGNWNANGFFGVSVFGNSYAGGANGLSAQSLFNANGQTQVPVTAFSLFAVTPTVVPEPGTMALAGLGGLSLLLFRRKK